MSIEHMRKMTLYAGISIILSAFVLAGCSRGSRNTVKNDCEVVRFEELSGTINLESVFNGKGEKNINFQTKWLLYELQKAYTQQYQWYYPTRLDFYYVDVGEKYFEIELDKQDLERVTFYQDTEEGTIYFVPANDQIINLLKGGEQEEMFVFRRIETRPRRSITPPPDSVFYSVGVRSVADIRDRLIELGTEKMKFPDAGTIERRGWTDNTLTENEYTQAVKDMIHGTLVGEQQYGNYEIYFAEYSMSDDAGIHEEEFGGMAVHITAAVVCLDNGYGYYCRFFACDQLIDGKVKIYYYVSDTANVWEENIRNAMEDRRLMIPLEVRPGDEVEVPPNPYPFVMLPVLDYAEGEGIFPEDAIRSGDMIFY